MAQFRFLTKSIYIKNTKCPLAAWYEANDPSSADPSETVKERKNEAKNLNLLARELFKGIKSAGNTDVRDYLAITDNYRVTADLLAQKVAVCDATFVSGQLVTTADIVIPVDDGIVIYEVKNATAPREGYIHELAYIAYVAKQCGYKVSKCGLIVVNKDYTRGKTLNPTGLLRKIDLTKRVAKYESKVVKNCEKTIAFLMSGQKPAPVLCKDCERPFGCEYYDSCFGKWLDKPCLFTFHGVDAQSRYELYSKGIISLDDLRKNKQLLKPKFANLIKLYDEKTVIVKEAELKKFLDSLTYPLYFLDFESLQGAIPPYKGTKPLETVPFQYSLHGYMHEGSPLTHSGYIAKEGEDAREEIAKRLATEIPDGACVLAFGKFLECKVLGQLAQMFPEYRQKLTDVKNNVKDIGALFANGTVYYWNMLGSASLKTVFKCVSPEEADGYESGAVHNGADAMASYLMMQGHDEKTKKDVFNALWEYCKLDTLSMVRILEDLKKRV